jgi:hypothetical protein
VIHVFVNRLCDLCKWRLCPPHLQCSLIWRVVSLSFTKITWADLKSCVPFIYKDHMSWFEELCPLHLQRSHELIWSVVSPSFTKITWADLKPSYFLIKWWWCLFCTIPFWQKKYKIMPSFMSRWSWVCLWCVTLPNKDLSCKVCM